jgi:hypothetical protein
MFEILQKNIINFSLCFTNVKTVLFLNKYLTIKKCKVYVTIQNYLVYSLPQPGRDRAWGLNPPPYMLI